jgi:hypothetical protein
VQVGVGDIDLFFGAYYFFFRGKSEDVAGFNEQGAIFNFSYAELGALQIGQALWYSFP